MRVSLKLHTTMKEKIIQAIMRYLDDNVESINDMLHNWDGGEELAQDLYDVIAETVITDTLGKGEPS